MNIAKAIIVFLVGFIVYMVVQFVWYLLFGESELLAYVIFLSAFWVFVSIKILNKIIQL
jgi:hypothetical protein